MGRAGVRVRIRARVRARARVRVRVRVRGPPEHRCELSGAGVGHAVAVGVDGLIQPVGCGRLVRVRVRVRGRGRVSVRVRVRVRWLCLRALP